MYQWVARAFLFHLAPLFGRACAPRFAMLWGPRNKWPESYPWTWSRAADSFHSQAQADTLVGDSGFLVRWGILIKGKLENGLMVWASHTKASSGALRGWVIGHEEYLAHIWERAFSGKDNKQSSKSSLTYGAFFSIPPPASPAMFCPFHLTAEVYFFFFFCPFAPVAPCRLLLVHILKSALIYLSKFLLFIFGRLWRLDVMLSVAGRIVEVIVVCLWGASSDPVWAS